MASLNDSFQITQSVRASLSGGFVSDHQHKGGATDPLRQRGGLGRRCRLRGGGHCVLEVRSGVGDGWSSICGWYDLVVTCAGGGEGGKGHCCPDP